MLPPPTTLRTSTADDMTDIDRQLWEIDENLMRAELSPTEMAEHLAKRKELWGQRSSGASCATGGGAPGENIGFASETAAATGISKSTVNRATSRAKAIPEDVLDQIKGTKLDTGTYLDWLKGMDPDDQRGAVRRCIYSGSIG